MIPFLAPFAGDPDQVADFETWAATSALDRAWVVDTGDRFVGNSAIYTLNVTVPPAPGQPCPTVPLAGVTAVGVHPTHRRRGLLRQLISTMHDDARERGEPLAGLEASESVIYGTFGYGLAANVAEYSIDSRASAFAVPAPTIDVTLIDRDEALGSCPGSSTGNAAPGPVRSIAAPASGPGSWPIPRHQRHGASAYFHAVCDGGYVLYRAGLDANVFQGQRARVVVDELRGLTPEIEAALWRFVLDLDLVGEVVVKRRAVDEPVRWRLADPRQLRSTGHRGSPVRTGPRHCGRLHGPRLSGRGSVGPRRAASRRPRRGGRRRTGPMGARSRAGGRRLSAGPSVARRPTSAWASPPSAPLYMGGFPASLLAAGGRVEELRPGGLSMADRLLATWPAPRSGTEF